jgi:hypothetical protein
MLKYSKFRYIYPPRPENSVPPGNFDRYERTYIAQPKLNGDSLLIFTNGIECHLYNRHKKKYTKAKDEKMFVDLHRETVGVGTRHKWMCLVGEYMSKGKLDETGANFNDNFVIFDILAYDSVQLVGSTVAERISLLDSIYGKDDKQLSSVGVRHFPYLYTTGIDRVYRVKSFMSDFEFIWETVTGIDMYEGLVFKMLNGKLENGVTQTNNSGWQFKVRKPHKNYKY